MKKILLQDKAIHSVNTYIRKYKTYFQNLYQDTGLFGLEKILDGYEMEAEKRRVEIHELLYKKLSEENIFGKKLNNTLQLSYRSKSITIFWKDEGEFRIITDIQIR